MQGSHIPATSWPPTRGAPARLCAAPTPSAPSHYWSLPRDASLNWLALGLLLAAWNAADDGAGQMQPPEAMSRAEKMRSPEATRSPDAIRRSETMPRPEHFRGYNYVSVRAARQSVFIR